MSFIDLSERNPFARMMKMLGSLAATNGHSAHAQGCNAIAARYSRTAPAPETNPADDLWARMWRRAYSPVVVPGV